MKNLSEAEVKLRIAKRVAEMLPDGGFVNLGVGIPTLAVDYLPAGKRLYIQTENGMLGVGPKPRSEAEIIPNLINASRTPITETPGCCYFDSATSFAMIRSGRMDATVIGAIQVNERGDLANWALPGKGVLGLGGAMDLVVGVKEVIVATSHTAKNGKHKLVKSCTVPLTGIGVVNTLVTEYAVFKFKDGKMFLTEHTSDITLDEMQAMTSAHYELAEKIQIREV
ncbi:MAG: 3-oxoacid CoA-transferase subunit B [Phascolarctobacterium sp.]|uniref:3-oxoacid CoA-transferase subunit B n=1 Tax=Phascolarctobacterium sp. TaxID=2049039 RepID=UPI0025E43057|nr:3-oxoacid CoA-transferase subunit B [Phascolarctobacterium sp.]MCC8159203.1 3-oxoacid CoA-transferase subunit B [Phascolarctobacterium sp.]